MQAIPCSLTMFWSTQFSALHHLIIFTVGPDPQLVYGEADGTGVKKGVFRQCQNESLAIEMKMSLTTATHVPHVLKDFFSHVCLHLPRES